MAATKAKNNSLSVQLLKHTKINIARILQPSNKKQKQLERKKSAKEQLKSAHSVEMPRQRILTGAFVAVAIFDCSCRNVSGKCQPSYGS